MLTSPNIHGPFDRREKSTIPKQIKTAERSIVFRKNHTVPLTTQETLSQRVIGVTKNKSRAINFDTQRRIPLFSTNQSPKKTLRVSSGNTNVIS
jgi:hypothetical protein